jgi:hypothetical protein
MEHAINHAFTYGLQHLDQAIAMHDPQYRQPWLKTYLTENVSYRLDAGKRAGMDLYLHKLEIYNL